MKALERETAENGAENEHPHRKILRLYVTAGKAHRAELDRLQHEGERIVLCGPDCPAANPKAAHAHTWWDMYRMRGLAEYECEVIRARNGPRIAGTGLRARLSRAGVGSVHLDALERAMDERAAFRVARHWSSQKRPMQSPDAHGNPARPGPLPYPWLVMLGAAGTGKTLAAAWGLRESFRARNWDVAGGARDPSPGLFVAVSELMTLDAFSEYGRERMEDMRRTPFLILDDIGAQSLSAIGLSLLYEVLDARYRDRRRTVITSNLNSREFEARVDSRQVGQEDGTQGRIFRRAVEIGYVCELTKEGGQLLVGGKKVKKGGTS